MSCVYYLQKKCIVKSLLQNINDGGKKILLIFLGKLVTVKMFFTYIKQLNKVSEKRPSSKKLNVFLCTHSSRSSENPLSWPKKIFRRSLIL